jgi:hypothetical protein
MPTRGRRVPHRSESAPGPGRRSRTPSAVTALEAGPTGPVIRRDDHEGVRRPVGWASVVSRHHRRRGSRRSLCRNRGRSLPGRSCLPRPSGGGHNDGCRARRSPRGHPGGIWSPRARGPELVCQGVRVEEPSPPPRAGRRGVPLSADPSVTTANPPDCAPDTGSCASFRLPFLPGESAAVSLMKKRSPPPGS